MVSFDVRKEHQKMWSKKAFHDLLTHIELSLVRKAMLVIQIVS